MFRSFNLALTALAPIIWGSSYIIATQFLSNLDPITISFLRAMPAGLFLLCLVRRLPRGIWIAKMAVLGALNFSIFWSLLFFAAHRLPGGVAAVMGALQPFFVIFAARALLGTQIRTLSLVAVVTGGIGVSLMVLTSEADLDALGIFAGLLGSASMAIGTVLSRKWQPPVSTLTFTAWQLTAGGVLLSPFAFFAMPHVSTFSGGNMVGLGYLGLIGAGLAYIIWLRGIRLLQPPGVSLLSFLSPASATVLGWIILSEVMTVSQLIGFGVVLASIFLGQHVFRPLQGGA